MAALHGSEAVTKQLPLKIFASIGMLTAMSLFQKTVCLTMPQKLPNATFAE